MIFPAPSGSASGVLFEDDGISNEWKNGSSLLIDWTLEYGPDFIDLKIVKTGSFRPAWEQIEVSLKVQDARPLRINGNSRTTLGLAEIPDHELD